MVVIYIHAAAPPTLARRASKKAWDRLLTGVIIDALEPGQTNQAPPASDVQTTAGALPGCSWQRTPAVGAGEEFRATFTDDRQGHCSLLDDIVVHGSLLCPADALTPRHTVTPIF